MTLGPATAAQIASAVYGIMRETNVDRAVRASDPTLVASGSFDFGKARAIGGTSGAGIRSATGFSMVVPCSGALQGEYIVATRGTVTGYDWLTDIAAAMEPGPGGCAVHAGFNRVARSVLLDINTQLTNKFPTRIHVVGHSLGGAVSNLLAASFATQGVGVELYTFGAPRAGLKPFRELLAQNVGELNMYRAFSLSDPVPMVPIHPFFHAPGVHPGALCGTRHGLVNPLAHMMTAYKAAVGQNLSWANLQNAARVTPMNVEELLRLAANTIRLPGISGGVYLLGRILQKILSAQNIVIGSAVTGAVTVLDQIGLTLFQAQRSNKEINEQLRGFMKYALLLAGIPFKITTAITAAYITHILTVLLRVAVGQASMAIQRADQDA